MKKTILVATLLLSALTFAQNSLFNNISTTDIYQEYYGVYDQDKDGFYNWLMEESIAFDNLKPMHFMDTSYGMQLIIHQLGRYAHGIFA